MSSESSIGTSNKDVEFLLPLATLFALLAALVYAFNSFQTKVYEKGFRALKKRNEVDVVRLYQLVSELLDRRLPLEENWVNLTTSDIGIPSEDPAKSCFDVRSENLKVLSGWDWIYVCGLCLLCIISGNVVMGVALILHVFVAVVQHRQQQISPQDQSTATRNLEGFYLCASVLSLAILHYAAFTVDSWVFTLGWWEWMPAQVLWGFLGVGLLVFDLLTYNRLVQLNKDTCVPLPFLLIPVSILAGGGATEVGCCAHAIVPFPYFAMCLVFFCVCTRKPTFRIAVFVYTLHFVWAAAVIYAESMSNECRIGLNASILNAVVCMIANTIGLKQHRHNFVFDSTDLGNKFWRVAVALCNCCADASDLRYAEAESQGSFLEGLSNLSEITDIVSKADTLLRTDEVHAKWPSLGELALKFAVFTVYAIIVKLNGSIYFFPSKIQGDQVQQLTPSTFMHFLLMAITALLVICVWWRPFSCNEVTSQDFRFLLRGISFSSTNIMVIHHCMEHREISSVASFAAYCFDIWAWYMASAHPFNLTDFRILSMMVSMKNIIVSGTSPTWLTQACSQVVLLDLLDIRTQRLLSRNDKVAIMTLRVLSMATLLSKSNRYADIGVSVLLFFPFSNNLELD